MENKFNKIWNNKYVFGAHQVINIALFVYGISYSIEKPDFLLKYIIFCAFMLFITIIEAINHRSKRELLQQKVMGFIYHVARPVVAITYYYMASSKVEGYIFLIMLLWGIIELILYFAIYNPVRRAIIYFIFAMIYGMTSLIMLVSLIQDEKSQVTLLIGIREIAIVLVVIVVVMLFCEAMSLLWGYFETQLLKQNRVVEDLNKANETLCEHQEKINHVNEKLGLQKIELQTANKRINRAHDELLVQNEISSVIAGSIKKEEMLKQIVSIMKIRLDMDLVAVILEEDKDLDFPGQKPKGRYVAMVHSLEESFERNFMDSIHKTDLKELLSMSQTYIQNTVTDSVKLFEYLTDEQEISSIICLPITNMEERLGTVVVAKNRYNIFMDSREFYENIASQIGIGISNARLYAKMQDMAIRDGLTKIYNRRYLTEVIGQYLTEAIKRKIPLSLALFDIDKFKMINDTYGHSCGDEVIRHVAALLNQGALEHGGIAGRYGGEEFVIAFLDKDKDETYEIIKEIHNQIRSKEVAFEGKQISVRASVGLASYPSTCFNPSELLTRADWAMYHSKKNGRDQITIDNDEIVDKM